jgi:hypothetical protein
MNLSNEKLMIQLCKMNFNYVNELSKIENNLSSILSNESSNVF